MYILGLLVLLEVLGPPELANVVVSRSNLCQQSVCAYLSAAPSASAATFMQC